MFAYQFALSALHVAVASGRVLNAEKYANSIYVNTQLEDLVIPSLESQ